MYFGNRGSLSGPPFAQLDGNDADGFGPETMTISQLVPGQYTYAVQNASNEVPFASSGAQVQVFRGSSLAATFPVPAGSGRWWTVLRLDGASGAIVPVGTLSNAPPLPSAVQPLASPPGAGPDGAVAAAREAQWPLLVGPLGVDCAAVGEGDDGDCGPPADGEMTLLGTISQRPLLGAPPAGLLLATRGPQTGPPLPPALDGPDWQPADVDALGAVLGQDLGDQATLETRQPEVQWSAAGAEEWQSVPSRQAVRAGDRVRTGAGAAARLVYFEGSVTELGPQTGVLVQRLEPSPSGNVIGNLFQAAGTTVSRVAQLVDPSARFEVDTPAATAFVRGTTVRVQVAGACADPEPTPPSNCFTRVANISDGTGGLVGVEAKDPNRTTVMLQPGEQTDVVPGQPPSAPSNTTSSGQASETAQQAFREQAERQQQRQIQQAQAQAQVAQQQAALIAAQIEADRLAQQEQSLLQDINQTLAGRATPVVPRNVNVPPPSGVPGAPCARVGGTCAVAGPSITGSAQVTGSATYTVTATGPAGTLVGGTPAVFWSTTAGVEAFACSVVTAGLQTTCTGSLVGTPLLGSNVVVRFALTNGGTADVIGTVSGPGVPTPTATPPPGQIRIMLTWGALPRDLDAHLWVPLAPSGPTAARPDGPAAAASGAPTALGSAGRPRLLAVAAQAPPQVPGAEGPESGLTAAPAHHPSDAAGAQQGSAAEVVVSADELAAAMQLVSAVWRGTARFVDVAVAEAEGYRPITTPVDGLVHYHNQTYYLARRVLDPERPEQLVYWQRPDGEMQLVGVMFVAPPGQRGPRVGGPLTLWHAHDDLCVNLADGLLTSRGNASACPPGAQPFGTSPEMLHVWLVDNPAGVFARDLDPAALLPLLGSPQP